jgi:hypothetical protein
MALQNFPEFHLRQAKKSRLKISEKCPVQPRKENTMSCESERKVLGLVESDLRKIAGSKDLDFLQVTSDQDRASESERR